MDVCKLEATSDATIWLSDIAMLGSQTATALSDLALKETLKKCDVAMETLTKCDVAMAMSLSKCNFAMETVQCELLAMLDVGSGFPSIFVESFGPVKVRVKFLMQRKYFYKGKFTCEYAYLHNY